MPLLLIFCTLWRLPMLGDPPWLNDEGTYATVGRAVFEGEGLYRQVWENKPPAIYLLYGAIDRLVGPSHLLTGVRLASLLASLLTLLAVYHLARRAGARSALLAGAVAGALIDLPLLEGTAANAEVFVIACTSGAMLLLWRGTHNLAPAPDPVRRGGHREGLPDHARSGQQGARLPHLVAAGAALGVAILFKLVAGADLLAALGLGLAWRRPLRLRLAAGGALLGGAALPIALVAGWLAVRGLLGQALHATVAYNRGYVGTGQTLHAPLVTGLSLLAPLFLLGLALWLARRPRPTAAPRADAALCWWLALATLGALASGRSYPHYYLQVVPPLATATALLTGRLGQTDWSRRALTGLLALWAGGVPLISWLALTRDPAHPAPGSNRPAYYAYAWQHLTGGLGDAAYGERIDPRVGRNVTVASYLRAHPTRSGRLYVWGNAPWIYYLSEYEHAARFLSAYYNPPIPGGQQQVRTSLRRAPPPYIVVIEPPTPADAALARFISSHYIVVLRRAEAAIYELRR